MSQSQTSGYDLLVQLSEQELNAQMRTAFPIPRSMTFTKGTLNATVGMTFDRLELDVSSQTAAIPNCVRLFIGLDVVVSLETLSFTGFVEVGAPLKLDPDTGTPRRLIVDFTGTGSAKPYVFVQANEPGKDVVTALCKSELEKFFKKEESFELSPPIDLPPSADPLAPTDIHMKVVDDPDPLGIDCVTFMINTGGSGGGDPAGITKFVGASPSGAVVVLSNQLLLERIIRPALETELVAPFNAPCTLAQRTLLKDAGEQTLRIGPINYDVHLKIYLDSMTVFVEGDHLRAVGAISGSGFGWSLWGVFDVRLYLELSNGTISVRQQTDVMEAQFDFKWWVWLVLAMSAGTLAVIVVALAQREINRVIDSIISMTAELAARLGSVSVPAIPLGPAGGVLEIQSVLLDDLVMQGPVTRIPASATGVSLRGDLVAVRKEATIVLNGNLATFKQLLAAAPGLPYTITTRRAFRGVFGADAAQPLMPVAFQWNLAGMPLTGKGPQSIAVDVGLGPSVVFYQAEGAHCWLWTAAGTTVSLQLAVTMTDGAGHASHAIMMLQRTAVEIETGVTQDVKQATILDDILAAPFDPRGRFGDIQVVDPKFELERAVDASAGKKTAAGAVGKTPSSKVEAKKPVTKR